MIDSAARQEVTLYAGCNAGVMLTKLTVVGVEVAKVIKGITI